MQQFPWTCHACRSPNAMEEDACTQCGCPAQASGLEIKQHLANYSGPIHPSAEDDQLADGTQTLVGKKPYVCPKCGHNRCRVGNARTSGGFLSAVFEVDSQHFSYVACGRCRYTEFYQCDVSSLGMLFDFLVG